MTQTTPTMYNPIYQPQNPQKGILPANPYQSPVEINTQTLQSITHPEQTSFAATQNPQQQFQLAPQPEPTLNATQQQITPQIQYRQ